MKRKFNIYCILMLVAMVVGLTVDFSLKAGSVMSVLKEVDQYTNEASAANADRVPYLIALDLQPTGSEYIDHHIIDRKTGKSLPAKLASAMVKCDGTQKKPMTLLFLTDVCSLISIASIVVLWVYFIQLVLAVNRGMVFDRSVEHRLRMIGLTLLILYMSGWGTALGYYEVEKIVTDIEGYRVVIANYPSLMDLLSGLGMLMIAQIFGIGRKMKEEQELTI